MELYFLLVYWFIGSSAQANLHIENQIVLQCLTDICEPEKEISEFLYKKEIFTFGDVWIVVQNKGQDIYRESLKTFIYQYWIKNQGYGAASARKVKYPLNNLSSVVSPADAALNCQYDMDYSCRDWQSSPYYGDYIIELDSYIRSVEIRFVVNQQFIDANTEAKNNLVAAALTVPSARLGSFLLKYAEFYIPTFVAESLIFTSISKLITLPPSLEVGDMLVFRDGEVTVIKPWGSSTSYYYPADGNSGSGASSGGGAQDYSGSTLINLGGGLCKTTGTVCTGGGCNSWVQIHPCENQP